MTCHNRTAARIERLVERLSDCVRIMPDQRVETLVRAMAEHFALFAGLPPLAVFDGAYIQS